METAEERRFTRTGRCRPQLSAVEARNVLWGCQGREEVAFAIALLMEAAEERHFTRTGRCRPQLSAFEARNVLWGYQGFEEVGVALNASCDPR